MADNVGAIKYGDEVAQLVSRRFLGAFATEAALTNLALAHRADGGVAVVVTGPSWWQYDIDSTLTESTNVRSPDDGVGRWIAMGSGGGVGPAVTTARLCTAAAMAASTRTANVRVANANGAMANIDGTAPAVGDIVLDKDNATGADRGLWIIDSLGGVAAKWQMTRAPAMDTSDDCVPGMLIAIAEGTANGDKTFTLTTNAAITLNTTTLTFATVAVTAATVSVADTAGLLTSTTVEAALAELASSGGDKQVAIHAVRGASTANVASLAAFTVANDGITFVEGERVLLKNQGTGSQNGIYIVGTVGGGTAPLTRDADFDATADAKTSSVVVVSEGTANADTIWMLTTNAPIVLGTTALTFAEVWTAARGLATAGAAQGAIADADSAITATKIEDALTEIATSGLPNVSSIHKVRGASTANVAALATFTVANDGITFVEGERVLLKNQTAPEENGVYVVGVVGGGTAPLTRATDFDNAANCSASAIVVVSEGTAGANTVWKLDTNDPITVGTTGLVFTDVVHDVSGAAAGAITDADGAITATTIEGALNEIATSGLPKVSSVHKCRGASTANLASFAGAGTTIDGVTYVDGERIFCHHQTATEENGIYVWSGIAGAAGDLSRDTDFDNAANVSAGAIVTVSEGTLGANTVWKLDTNDPITVGTTGLTFVDAVHDVTGAAAGAIADAGGLITGTTIEAALAELAGDVNTLRPGVPMFNRIQMLGAPGAIVNGDYLTIGADVFEFRNSSPPAGGTAGRIWVYQGADSAASRANFLLALNNTVSANEVTYDGARTELVNGEAGTTLGDINIFSVATLGSSTPVASSDAIACTDNLTTATDIWDAATMYNGQAGPTATQIAMTTVALTADQITKGEAEFMFTFTPQACIVVNRMRPQNEAYTITGTSVILTCAGGGAPNNQATDVIDVIAIG